MSTQVAGLRVSCKHNCEGITVCTGSVFVTPLDPSGHLKEVVFGRPVEGGGGSTGLQHREGKDAKRHHQNAVTAGWAWLGEAAASILHGGLRILARKPMEIS